MIHISISTYVYIYQCYRILLDFWHKNINCNIIFLASHHLGCTSVRPILHLIKQACLINYSNIVTDFFVSLSFMFHLWPVWTALSGKTDFHQRVINSTCSLCSRCSHTHTSPYTFPSSLNTFLTSFLTLPSRTHRVVVSDYSPHGNICKT